MKLLQFPNLGKNGRLGNQLFQIASTIGIALRNGYTPRFPEDWAYRDKFNVPDEYFGPMLPNDLHKIEYTFNHHIPAIAGDVVNLHGYYQSPKYWEGYERLILTYLQPKGLALPGYINTVTLHYRRGDYVGNGNYYQLPLSYYISAYDKFCDGKQLIAFSDDKAYLNIHNDNISSDDEVTDLINMSLSNTHILSNSTFSWWAAYLSGSTNVIYPSEYFAGQLAQYNNTKDFYPKDYIKHDVTDKATLTDTAIIIPVRCDSEDRRQNLHAVVHYLQAHFNVKIIIGEINTKEFDSIPGTEYLYLNYTHFHRTKALNELTKAANCKYVINYDADVFIPPWQLYETVQKLKQGNPIVYPYDGTFYWCGRDALGKITRNNDLGDLAGMTFRTAGATIFNSASYGGAVGYNVSAFFAVGGENENFISYGAEDQERWCRFTLMSLNPIRVSGPLYHIDHWRGADSCESHPHAARNRDEWHKIKLMTKGTMQNYINESLHPRLNIPS